MNNFYKVFLGRTCGMWRRILEDSRRILGLLNKLQYAVFGSLNRERCIAAYLFSKCCISLLKDSGFLFLGMYLKSAHVALVRYMAGSPREMLPVRVSLTSCGIPRIIPSFHREVIRRGPRDPRYYGVVQMYLSWFSLYKMVRVPRKVPLDNISEPSSLKRGYERSKVCRDLSSLATEALKQVSWDGVLDGFEELSFSPSWTSSPSSRSASRDTVLTTLHREALVLMSSKALPQWQALLGSVPGLFPLVYACAVEAVPSFKREGGVPVLARLGFVTEPAGKTRIFAMCNSFLQSVLHPYQGVFMKLLRGIPMDGTFNQLKPLDRLKGARKSWCYDLTAATDRFPFPVQQKIVEAVLGPRLALRWSQAIDSTFEFNLSKVSWSYDRATRLWPSKWGQKSSGLTWTLWKGKLPREHRFQVAFGAGQPLGSHSSWSVFSFSHHLVVQLAARQAGFEGWYTRYALLGDDILLTDAKVAHQYKSLMRYFGTSFSPLKSVISRHCGEFAKRLRVDNLTRDVSPLSARWMTTITSPIPLNEMLKRISEYRKVSLSDGYRLMGLSFKLRVRPNAGRTLRTRITLTSPKGVFPLPFDVWVQKGPGLIYPWSIGSFFQSKLDRLGRSTLVGPKLDRVPACGEALERFLGGAWVAQELRLWSAFLTLLPSGDVFSFELWDKEPLGLPSDPYRKAERVEESRSVRTFGRLFRWRRRIVNHRLGFLGVGRCPPSDPVSHPSRLWRACYPPEETQSTP